MWLYKSAAMYNIVPHISTHIKCKLLSLLLSVSDHCTAIDWILLVAWFWWFVLSQQLTRIIIKITQILSEQWWSNNGPFPLIK